VIYDPKLEFYPMLLALGVPAERIDLLNPFDLRCQWWDMAQDYTTTADALQLGKLLFPTSEHSQNPFFPNAAALLFSTVLALHIRRKPQAWDLADILHICTSLSCIRKYFLDSVQSGIQEPLVDMASSMLAEPKTADNVVSELVSRIFDLLPIAACWRHARREGRAGFSIRTFVKSDRIALIGTNETNSQTLMAINRILLKRLSEEILDTVQEHQWQARQRTWLFLDELRELGKVQGLNRLLGKGRSRGVCVVLGFQDYPALSEAFGQDAAHELTAMCEHRLFLKLGHQSAIWASEVIGSSEIKETTLSYSSSFGSNKSSSASEGGSLSYDPRGRASSSSFGSTSQTTGTSDQFSVSSSTSIRETQAVLPSEIAHLPRMDTAGGLVGFVCRQQRTGLPSVTKMFVPAALLLPPPEAESTPVYLPRPRQQHDLWQSLL
jgi:hypothetical protein